MARDCSQGSTVLSQHATVSLSCVDLSCWANDPICWALLQSRPLTCLVPRQPAKDLQLSPLP